MAGTRWLAGLNAVATLIADGTLQFRIKARNASIANVPTAPLVATVVLGTSPGAGAAGRCGQITFTGVLGSRFFP